MKRALLIVAALVAAAEPASADDVIARVGSDEITFEQLVARARESRPAGGSVDTDPLLEDLINEAALRREGYRLGLEKDPAVVAAVEEARRRAAAARLAAVELEPAETPEELLLEMYHETADSVRLEKVVVASRIEAAALRTQIRKGGSFAAEVKGSLDPSDAQAPKTLLRGQLPAKLAAAAFAAPVGELIGPVELELGWAVLRVLERSLGDAAGFAARRASIAEFVRAQVQTQAKHHLLTELRKNVKLDEDFLTSMGTRMDATAEEVAHVVAVVGGRDVEYGAVLARVRSLSSGYEGGHMSGPSVKINLAWAIVDDLLLQDAAVARGLGEDAQVVAAARAAEGLAVVRAVAERARRGVTAPAAAEIKAWYDQHATDFARPARRTATHILVAEAKIARELRKRLCAGASWDELALEYSEDSGSAATGGLLGELTDDQLDAVAAAGEAALAAAIKGARQGKVSEPVKSAAGWHLVRVTQIVPASQAALAEVEPLIAARLLAERGDAAVRAEIERARVKAKITIDREALARAAERAAATGARP